MILLSEFLFWDMNGVRHPCKGWTPRLLNPRCAYGYRSPSVEIASFLGPAVHPFGPFVSILFEHGSYASILTICLDRKKMIKTLQKGGVHMDTTYIFRHSHFGWFAPRPYHCFIWAQRGLGCGAASCLGHSGDVWLMGSLVLQLLL